MKAYVKPELFYEHFELSQHIAACAWDLNLANEDVCGFQVDTSLENNYPADTVLLTGERSCNFDGPYCYMSSTGGLNTFNS